MVNGTTDSSFEYYYLRVLCYYLFVDGLAKKLSGFRHKFEARVVALNDLLDKLGAPHSANESSHSSGNNGDTRPVNQT